MDSGFPDAFLCPITQDLMQSPTIDPEGNSYERAAIDEWLAQNGTSPVTRTPLQMRDLTPNRALLHAIEQYKRDAAAAAAAVTDVVPLPGQQQRQAPPPPVDDGAPATKDEAVQASKADCEARISAASIDGPAENQATVLLTLTPPTGMLRTPTDVCCVIDTSGSMGDEASLKDEHGSTESHGLSLLDVVKHAVTTIISVLGPQDRLSLVAYSTEARVVCDLLVMDDSGKAQAKRALAALRSGGQTNLWDGLHSGLEVLRRGCEDSGNRLSAVLLLTDGQPNICPPRGHLAMLRKYKDQNVRLSATISTFGFGYRLDSQLLRELATEGDSLYAFIPDSGFVGTVFVNALSNLLVTMAKHTKLSLEPMNGASILEGAIPGGLPYRTTSWGVQVDVGSLQYGQSRHVVVRVNIPAGYVPGTPVFQATVEFETRHDVLPVSITTEVSHQVVGEAASAVAEPIIVQATRADVVDKLYQTMAVAAAQRGVGPDVQAILAELVARIKMTGLRDEHMQGMLADVEGQATMALSSAEYWHKWGAHYLPSLARAHQLEQCNNFKDPGVQNYGGKLFSELRDVADDLFCKLPPPKPSAVPFRNGGGGRYGRAGGAAAAVSHRPVDMSMYNSRGNSCFAGQCTVEMADGTGKFVSAVTKGDRVSTPDNSIAIVMCVLKTHCAAGQSELVKLPGGLLVTPWHPVRILTAGNTPAAGEWAFPATLATPKTRACPAVYSFVLDSQHVLTINGVECVTLAHGIEDDPVASHPFFGTQTVLDHLAQLPGYAGGLVELEPGSVLRDAESGLACGFLGTRQSAALGVQC